MAAEASLTDELTALEEAAGWVPVSGDSLVRVAGPGHREALQRVVSQDILGIPDGQSALALLLAPKGQFQAIMAVFPGAAECWLLTPPGRAAEVAVRLSRYLRLSRCTAEAVPLAGGLEVLGTDWAVEAAAAGADPAVLARGGWQQAGAVTWFGRTLAGISGAVGVAREPAALVAAEARLGGVARLSAEAVRIARIRVGWPEWGAELTEAVLPPEAGIEGETISFTKGCYIGQETIARLRTYGHPNRSLVGLHQVAGGDDPPALPVALHAAGEEKVRGSVTSWARHPERGGVALALVRREQAEPGTTLAGAGRTFVVAPFPLW